jgi:SnoaL-like domain
MTQGLQKDPAGFIQTALTEVCFGQENSHPLEATIDRYFTPDYTQRTDGQLTGREEFAAHIATLRGLTACGTVKVSEAIRDGNRIADRHEVSVTKRDGTTSRIEVYLFGELAGDGRLRRVEEITRVIQGGEDDARLARVR